MNRDKVHKKQQMIEGVNSYLLEDDEEDARHEPEVGVYHASHGGRCLRKRYYQDKNVEKGKSKYGIFERGERIEDFIEETLIHQFGTKRVRNSKGVSYVLDEEEDIVLTGSTDPYVLDEDCEDIYILTEVKSTSNIHADYIPKQSHKFQLNTYLSILGIDYGYLWYVHTDNWKENKIIPYEQDEELWETTKERHLKYHEFRESDIFPPKDTILPKECSFCDFQSLCTRGIEPDQMK